MAKPKDLAKLQKSINTLNKAWGSMDRKKTLVELLRLIKQPGWTTPSEYLLVQGIIDSLLEQTLSIQRLNERMIQGAREVGQR